MILFLKNVKRGIKNESERDFFESAKKGGYCILVNESDNNDFLCMKTNSNKKSSFDKQWIICVQLKFKKRKIFKNQISKKQVTFIHSNYQKL